MEAIARSIGAPSPLRITFELLRPVPIGRMTVLAEATAEGRAVRRIVGSVHVDGAEVIRAVGLFAAPRPVEVDVIVDDGAPTKASDFPSLKLPFFRWSTGYHTAMDLRYARGTVGQARVFAWLRMRIALVAGESPSPLQRVIATADSGNGVTAALYGSGHTFMNPDLTVALERLPSGEWIGLDAEMRTDREGLGIATTALWDDHGVIGRGVQTLLVRKLG